MADQLLVTLNLPFPPSGNRYWRIVDGRAVKSEAARKYKKDVGKMLMVQMLTPTTDEVIVHARVYFPNNKFDLDNSLKVLLDVLQGHVYRTDNQIVGIMAEKWIDPARPRVELAVLRNGAPRLPARRAARKGARRGA